MMNIFGMVYQPKYSGPAEQSVRRGSFSTTPVNQSNSVYNMIYWMILAWVVSIGDAGPLH